MPTAARTLPQNLAAQRIAIIGAGPTGLGAAWRLTELGLNNFTIFERAGHVGGLAASFTDAAGFTWDVGGHVQFSHYGYFDAVMDRVMRDDWCRHDRESWIWIRDTFVPYPLQNNIAFLPDAERRACLVGLLRRNTDRLPARPDFGTWVRATFGDGLADVFMLPYNRKVWAYPASDLGHYWVGERVAAVDLERVVLNVLDHKADVGWGPNNQFRFPAFGGTGEIWRRVAAGLPSGSISLGAEIVAIDVERRRLQMADGFEEPYDLLISTMPLDQLGSMSHVARDRGPTGLKFSTVHVVGIGLKGAPPPALAKKCWIYYPEGVCPFYRLTVFSNYSPRNVPDASQYWSVMVEVSESPMAPVDREYLLDAVLDGLRAVHVIASNEQVVSSWQYTAPYGYPTPFIGRDEIVDPLLERFEQHNVFSRGRFGAWKYEVSNQDHSFMQGVELVDRLATGSEETTLRRPAMVNASRAVTRA